MEQASGRGCGFETLGLGCYGLGLAIIYIAARHWRLLAPFIAALTLRALQT